MGLALDISFSPTADLYCLLRQLSSSTPSEAAPWTDVVPRCRDVFASASTFQAELLLDPAVAGWNRPLSELQQEAAELPTEIAGVAVREFVEAVAALMVETFERYREVGLPGRKVAAEKAMEDIARRLGPVEEECLAFLSEAFDLDDDGGSIRVRVVASGVPLGGMTNQDFDDIPLCLVAAENQEGSLLAEVVLHEASHAIGLMTADSSWPIARIHQALQERGLDREWDLGQLWHVPYFVTAGEAVRRYIDPGHVPYGAARGYYAKCPRASAIAVPTWQAKLDGMLSGEEAVERMLADLDI